MSYQVPRRNTEMGFAQRVIQEPYYEYPARKHDAELAFASNQQRIDFGNYAPKGSPNLSSLSQYQAAIAEIASSSIANHASHEAQRRTPEKTLAHEMNGW
jgi:hypothetical protein